MLSTCIEIFKLFPPKVASITTPMAPSQSPHIALFQVKTSSTLYNGTFEITTFLAWKCQMCPESSKFSAILWLSWQVVWTFLLLVLLINHWINLPSVTSPNAYKETHSSFYQTRYTFSPSWCWNCFSSSMLDSINAHAFLQDESITAHTWRWGIQLAMNAGRSILTATHVFILLFRLDVRLHGVFWCHSAL